MHLRKDIRKSLEALEGLCALRKEISAYWMEFVKELFTEKADVQGLNL